MAVRQETEKHLTMDPALSILVVLAGLFQQPTLAWTNSFQQMTSNGTVECFNLFVKWHFVEADLVQIVDPGNSMPLSSPMTSHMSKFGLLCQTANLLGSVLKNASSSPMKRDDIWVQLDRTLHSLLAAVLDLESPDSDSIAFIYRYVWGEFLDSL